MAKYKINGDTPLGRRLQRKANKKRDKEEISEYISLKLSGLTEDQKRLMLEQLSEKYHNE